MNCVLITNRNSRTAKFFLSGSIRYIIHVYINGFGQKKNELKHDTAKKAAKIKAVGEIHYEVFASVASRELYDRNNAGWFSVSIAKGLTTAEALVRLFAFCRPFFVNGKNSTAA